MQDVRAVCGTTEVYSSFETREFGDAENYPIAWEVIFINDATGEQFAANLERAFAAMPKERGYILDLQGESEDKMRCIECVFRDKNAFSKILRESLPSGMAIYDEQRGEVVPKQALVDRAGAVCQEAVLAL